MAELIAGTAAAAAVYRDTFIFINTQIIFLGTAFFLPSPIPDLMKYKSQDRKKYE